MSQAVLTVTYRLYQCRFSTARGPGPMESAGPCERLLAPQRGFAFLPGVPKDFDIFGAFDNFSSLYLSVG